MQSLNCFFLLKWLRAKTARFLLKEVGWNLQNVWSTREIVLWARFHGYTPGLPEEDTTQPRNMSCGKQFKFVFKNANHLLLFSPY